MAGWEASPDLGDRFSGVPSPGYLWSSTTTGWVRTRWATAMADSDGAASTPTTALKSNTMTGPTISWTRWRSPLPATLAVNMAAKEPALAPKARQFSTTPTAIT